jgi:formate hydrogenlyase subunit 3/multisubunit Na+/H+ antiporter MnhD subunit
MALLTLLPLLACPSFALLVALLRRATLCRFAPLLAALVVLGSGIALVGVVLDGSTPTALDGVLRVDALSAFMLTVVGSVGLTAAWGGLSARGIQRPDWLYAALVPLFLAAMSLAVLADNLGVLWVAVEATTIATAFLVGHQRSRQSLEAAWKYVVLGSVGVAIAFLGIALLYSATLSAGTPTLSWSVLDATSPAMDPSLVTVAGALTVLGFATKAGLAPMHSWLPDAHSQAPAPVSGLMSGVLLSVAFYAILRVQAIIDPVIGPELMRRLLVTAGLLSLAVAAALILRQRDLKRMLAYSSIEHMGLLALAAAIGGTLALAAALLHVLGHGLAKSTTFVVSGRILVVEGTTQLAEIRPMLARRPGLAVPVLLGMTALLGLPPFSLFFSEVAIVVAGFQAGMGWVMVVAVALVLMLFAGLARHTSTLMFGPSREGSPNAAGPPPRPDETPLTPDRSAHGPRMPLVVALGVTAVVGFVGGPVATLLAEAANVLGGTP